MSCFYWRSSFIKYGHVLMVIAITGCTSIAEMKMDAEDVKSLSNVRLCRKYVSIFNTQVVTDEVKRRSLSDVNCNQLVGADNARLEQEARNNSKKEGALASNSSSINPAHGNIADAFFRDYAAAIKYYGVERNISLTVHEIESRPKVVTLTERQAPTTVIQQSEQLQKKPFNWNDFRATSMGPNIYSEVYEISCWIDMARFNNMNIRKGAAITLKGKLVVARGKDVRFECY